MSLTFYYTPMSSATRVHWALEELEVPYEKVKVDLSKGEQKKPEYLALNPNAKVPLLVADGVPIFESLAILLHLGETYGVAKNLFPKEGTRERVEALKWMCWTSVTVHDALSRFLRNNSERFPADERNAKAAESAKKELEGLLGILDRHLAGKEYVVGNGFTLVDGSMAAFMPFLARLGLDLGPFKEVNAWVARCTSRPALGRAMMG
jgi:glutathione S-transferase